jgi:hypothetical protein
MGALLTGEDSVEFAPGTLMEGDEAGAAVSAEAALSRDFGLVLQPGFAMMRRKAKAWTAATMPMMRRTFM